MRTLALAVTVLVGVLLVAACSPAATPTSSPGGGQTTQPASNTPRPSGGTTGVEILKFSVDDQAITPQRAEIKANQQYKVEFTNTGNRPHAFVAHRWRIDVFARAGATEVSEAFSEPTPSEEGYPCFERVDAGRNPNMKCVIVVKP